MIEKLPPWTMKGLEMECYFHHSSWEKRHQNDRLCAIINDRWCAIVISIHMSPKHFLIIFFLIPPWTMFWNVDLIFSNETFLKFPLNQNITFLSKEKKNKHNAELQRTDPGTKVTGEFSTRGHIFSPNVWNEFISFPSL